MCLPRKVRQRVDTLPYKVEPVWLPAAVENFEVKDPLEKESMRSNQLFSQDRVLVNDSDRPDEHAEMGVVCVRKNPIENTRTQTIDIVQILPSFITARDLLLRISRSIC